MITEQEERDLREALDNIWGELTIEQINNQDPSTVQICRNNHYLLHHSEES